MTSVGSFENMTTKSTENVHQEVLSAPNNVEVEKEIFVGKIFSSIEEAEDCYQSYGAKNGFSIRRQKTVRGKRGSSDPTGMKFSCSCEGTYKKRKTKEDEGKIKRNTSTIREGCKARMRIVNIKSTDLWKVSVFFDDHSHALVTPSKRIHLKSRRRVPAIAKALTESFSRERLQINKISALFGGSSNTEYDERDLYNHLRNVRATLNECGDAEAVRVYFNHMVQRSKDFYYAIDTDEQGKAVNFFWVDGRSRLAYKQFGDVVTFDTTYRTNKYSMPFGPFTGANHHHQSILFGCALLENEVEATFVWVFQHWLQAMEGRHPISIITDQDKAMTNAIAKVFPNTRHRFCLWHIKKKFAEKLSHIFFKKSEFKKAVKKCTRFAWTIEDFENQWANLIENFELHDNDWMDDLYRIRQNWVPVYCRSTFFVGMNTTQRSESINSFFDGFVSAKTSLKEFVTKYDEALESIYVKERKEDYISTYKKRVLNIEENVLVHAANTYTRNIFEKFEEQFKDAYKLRVDETDADSDVQTYIVRYRNGSNGERKVRMNLTTKEGSCECQLFEFVGIPCKHLIRVFDRLYLDEIPPYFIMRRWKKDTNRSEIISQYGKIVRDPRIGEEAARANFLIQQSTQCAYLACKSEESFNLCIDTLHKLHKQLKELDDRLLQKENGHVPEVQPCISRVEGLLLDPHISQTKGRNKTVNVLENGLVTNNKRIKSGLEKATQKNKARVCRMCNGTNVGHDSRNCPSNPRKVENIAHQNETELCDEVADLG